MTSGSDVPLSTPSNASTASAMFLVADGFWDFGMANTIDDQVDEYGTISHPFSIRRLDVKI